MKIVFVLVLLVVATVAFHLFSPWWFTPIASNWTAIDTTIHISFWITGIVFIAVNLFMALAIYRYRYKKGQKAQYEPENKKLEAWLTGITAVGVAGLLAPGLFVWADFVDMPEDAPVVEVLGQQWHWLYRFPGEDGELGRTAPRFMSPENPFGLDPDDPAGQDDILVFSNILHLPVNQEHKVLLRSEDVLHNFSVPQFRAKMDLVPGMVTNMWLEPTRTGSFEVVCLQLCGMAHHAMRGRVVVQEEEDFEQWLDAQPTFAETRTTEFRGDPEAGREHYSTCAACHGQEGQGNKAQNAPGLASLDRHYLKRQLSYYKEGIRGAHEDDTLGQQMAAMMATLPDEQAIRDVSAYITTLPDQPAPETIEGNASRGERLYNNCKDCHGKQGEGVYTTRAPRLAGQHDWYLKEQIENFQEGIRGSHSGDMYGMQMMMMSKTLQSEQAIDDLIAFINSLE